MSVRLRMKRVGRTNSPSYRIVATDARSPRDGRVLEVIGQYDPRSKDPQKVVVLNVERAKYWLSVGAETSETVGSILKKHGLPSHNK